MEDDWDRCMGCGEHISSYTTLSTHQMQCQSRHCYRCRKELQRTTQYGRFDSWKVWECPNCQGRWCNTCGRRQLYSSYVDDYTEDLTYVCQVCGTNTTPSREPYKPPPSSVAPSGDDAILEAMIKGNRVLAMKLYRDKYHVGLAEAKKFIDSF